MCNKCSVFSPLDEWDYGCPACGYGNGHHEGYFSEFPGVEVMPDIQPFISPDGKFVTGRKQWRDHLKATDSIEMGHSDVKVAKEGWQKRKEAQFDRVKNAVGVVSQWNDANTKNLDAPIRRSNLAVEMANRLHNRPTPDRKTMIKLTLDEMKRISRGHR